MGSKFKPRQQKKPRNMFEKETDRGGRNDFDHLRERRSRPAKEAKNNWQKDWRTDVSE